MSGPTTATLKRLFALSSNRCAFPTCRTPLVDDNSGKVTGRVCHIKAQRSGGSRSDPDQTDEERHAFDNLLLMCPLHHDVIDADPDSYSVDRLLQIKREHERESRHVQIDEKVAEKFLEGLHVEIGAAESVVISHGQQGGITAHKVVVNNISTSPQPALEMKRVEHDQKGDLFVTKAILSVVSPYPIGNLYIEARGSSIIELQARAQRSGVHMTGHSGKREGYAFTNLPNAYGDILVQITTATDESVEIRYDLQ